MAHPEANPQTIDEALALLTERLKGSVKSSSRASQSTDNAPTTDIAPQDRVLEVRINSSTPKGQEGAGSPYATEFDIKLEIDSNGKYKITDAETTLPKHMRDGPDANIGSLGSAFANAFKATNINIDNVAELRAAEKLDSKAGLTNAELGAVVIAYTADVDPIAASLVMGKEANLTAKTNNYILTSPAMQEAREKAFGVISPDLRNSLSAEIFKDNNQFPDSQLVSGYRGQPQENQRGGR